MSEDVVVSANIERRFVEHQHRDLKPGLDRLRSIALGWPRMTREEAVDALLRVVHWAEHDVLPHLAWERAWWYPELDHLGGTPWVTRIARFEARHIQEQIATLDHASSELAVNHLPEDRAGIGLALAALHAELVLHLDAAANMLGPILEPAATARH